MPSFSKWHHRPRQWPLAVALVTAFALSGCSKSAGGEEAEEKEGPRTPVPVSVTVAASATLQPVVEFPGRVTVEPGNMASLTAPVECVVASLPVAEGRHVAKDAPIVEMDRRPFELEAEKAAAVLAKARAAAALLKAGPRPEDVEVARLEVKARQIDLESTREVAKGKAELREKNIVSSAEYVEADRKAAAAEAALQSAKARLAVLERGPRPEEVAQAEAELRAAAADDALARLHLDRCTVRSPIEGELARIAVHPGMALAVAAPIADILDLRHVLVEGVVPLSRLADLQVGATAAVTSSAWPGRPFEGRLLRISHQAEADSGDVAVWVAVDNPDELLRRDMAVRVSLQASPVEAKVAIPESAVIEQDGQSMAIVIKDGRTHNAPVKLGKHVEDRVEVREGLQPGDQVVTRGGYGLPEDYPVTITEQSSQPATQPAVRTAGERKKD